MLDVGALRSNDPAGSSVSEPPGRSSAQLAQTEVDASEPIAGLPRSDSLEPVTITHGQSAHDIVPQAASSGYLPRDALTRPPRPLIEPFVSVPAGYGAAGTERGVFSLFVSATGVVDSVVRDGPTLAPALEEAALEVLKATRFVAGEVDGNAVAALIRIEIVFENQLPVDSPAPVIVSQQPL